MTQQEKANFVGVLAEHVVNEVIDDIRSGKIPEEWDGIELRQLLADRFQRAVLKNTLTGGRKRRYNNACLINSL